MSSVASLRINKTPPEGKGHIHAGLIWVCGHIRDKGEPEQSSLAAAVPFTSHINTDKGITLQNCRVLLFLENLK